MKSSELSIATQNRLALIDLLRFIAAISVVFFHYGFRGERGAFVPPLHLSETVTAHASYGGMGVYLFFVISGFVIAYSAEGRGPWAFAASRFARLYPTYVLAMTVTALVLMFSGGVSITLYVANLLMFPKLLHQPMVDGVYWSIQFEVVFYAWVFVFLLFRVSEIGQRLAVIVWLVFSGVNMLVLKSPVLSLLFVTQYAGFFAAGIMLFRIRKEGATGQNQRVFAAAVFLSGVASYQEMTETLALYSAPFSLGVFLLIFFGMYVAVAFAALNRGGLRIGWIFMAVGALTYPLYLLHQMIGYRVITALVGVMPPGVALIATTAAMLILAFLVRRWFERPVVPAVRRGLESLFRRIGLEK